MKTIKALKSPLFIVLYQKWTLIWYKTVNLPFCIVFKPKFVTNGKIPFHIDIIYRIDHFCCIVFELDRGKPPLSTERYNEFIDFRSINYRFRLETILMQEFDWMEYFKNIQFTMKTVTEKKIKNSMMSLKKEQAMISLQEMVEF